MIKPPQTTKNQTMLAKGISSTKPDEALCDVPSSPGLSIYASKLAVSGAKFGKTGFRHHKPITVLKNHAYKNVNLSTKINMTKSKDMHGLSY